MIGILSQPKQSAPEFTYIMAAYVKFIEQGGARAVEILSNSSDEQIEKKLDMLNGVLFPGGDMVLQNEDGSLTEFSKKGKFILDYVKRHNENGVYYPLWAICQGFELLSVIESPNKETLVPATATRIPLNITFLIEKSNTRMFKEMSSSEPLETEAIAYHNNEFRVDPETFEKDANLKSYNVIAISYDRDNRPMVASIEHKTYPIYAHQYHPEKNEFIWIPSLPIPHTRNAIKLGIFTNNF
jgi:gamma-glutamyl hydrolase